MDRFFLLLIAADESMQDIHRLFSLSYMVRDAPVVESTPTAAIEDDASVFFSHRRCPKLPLAM